MPSHALGKPCLEALDHKPPQRNAAQSIRQNLDLIAFNGSIANSLGDERLEQGGVDHSFFHGLVLTDQDSGRTERYGFGEHAIVEEHLWIAKPGHGPERDERDAWLLGTHFDSRAKVTKLSVFDARSLADGPLAVASLPYWLPLGFHGNFQGT